VVLPIWYACAHDQEEIAWMAAVPLALAASVEAAGRRCEIWGFGLAAGAVFTHQMSQCVRSLICLKRADEPWSIHGAAATLHRGFFRRLGFRLFETLGPAYSGYGRFGFPHEVFAREAGKALADYAQIPTSRLVVGPWPLTYQIKSLEEARRWIYEVLCRLEIIERDENTREGE
jgi:hypothetical protein